VAGLYTQRGPEKCFSYITPCDEQLKALDGRIVECSYSIYAHQWRLVRERTDKLHPNAMETATSIWHTIRHPIRLDELMMFIANGMREREKALAEEGMKTAQEGGVKEY